MQTWGLTDPGNIRQQNQDSYAIVPFARDRVLMIVCDGMGGAKSGNVASSLAVEVFTGEVRRTQKAGMTPEKAAAMLRSALELANRAVYEQSQLSEDFTGMGTTLVAAFLSRDLAVIINVGDSRAYHFTREDVSLVTRDHSMVAYMVERGELTQEQIAAEVFDFLCRMADQEMLFEVVHGMSKSDCCQRLLHIAKKRGAPDNVTVALAAV